MFYLPVLIYIILYTPFLGITPYHDGSKEFSFSYNLYIGHYLSNWIPFQPPFKLILSSLFFYFFGFDSYTYLGLCLGALGIAVLFLIARELFDRKVALWSAIFLATSGLYLSNGIFSMTDFVVAVLILLSFYFYIRSYFWLYGIIVSCAVLTKETVLVFPISVFIVYLWTQKKLRFSLILPFLTFLGWLWFLYATGHQPWNDWNFSSTANQGSLYTVIHNLLTFQFLNRFAYENWRHLFIFNFDWFFWILAGFGIVYLFRKKKMFKNKANFLIIALYGFFYIIAVLSFQTFPITRYILPLLPFVYLFAGLGLVTILNAIKIEYWKYWAIAIVVLVIFMELFTSDDPVSNFFWGKTNFLGEEVYVSKLGGLDAMTYNMQFLLFAKKRDELIRSGDCEKNPDLEYRPAIFTLLHIPLCPNRSK